MYEPYETDIATATGCISFSAGVIEQNIAGDNVPVACKGLAGLLFISDFEFL